VAQELLKPILGTYFACRKVKQMTKFPSQKQKSDRGFWTHPSVLAFSTTDDPIGYIARRARSFVLEALEKGWSGPPFDPFQLAEFLKIRVVPNEEVIDARILPAPNQRFVIEFSPNRPRGRVRFSIAHELAHTLFPDCKEFVRERQAHRKSRNDDWQLEMLCNLAAAEILMPIGSFPDLRRESLNIDHLMQLRKKYDVSSEALLLRAIKLTEEPCFVFSSSERENHDPSSRYKVDYAVPSRTFLKEVYSGDLIPKRSCVEECAAIGFTAKGNEEWPTIGKVHVECVGIPPYPFHRYPRVAGIGTLFDYHPPKTNQINYLKGDATEPRGSDQKILAFIVNDKALAWGAGFGRIVQKKWSFVQKEFKEWAVRNRNEFTLGNAHISTINDKLIAFKMISQHGYGPSPTPRIKYTALESCLKKLAEEAVRSNASVHMPRIGSGQAGGSWEIISEIIDNTLCKKGIKVTVYDLP